jgi:hypothetical protein
MAGWKNHIVRVDDEQHFFTALRDGQVYGTEFPSAATGFEYDLADAICRRLRNRGYAGAVVCNLRGEPVNVARLKTTEEVSDISVLEYWDDGPTKEDWEILSLVHAEKDPVVMAKTLGITVAEFSTRQSEALRRFGNKT